jgi:hypothetical protein
VSGPVLLYLVGGERAKTQLDTIKGWLLDRMGDPWEKDAKALCLSIRVTPANPDSYACAAGAG